MLVATFGGDTEWAGRTITQEEGRFVLQGFGVISAAQVLEYDAATPLLWSTGGTRAWVRSIAHREGAQKRPAAPAAPVLAGPAAASAAPSATLPPSAPAASAQAQECTFPRARYVGGQPSLGASLAGSLHVTGAAIVLRGTGAEPGLTVELRDVARVGLHGAQATEAPGVSVSAGAGGREGGAPASDERTFVVVHLRPRGYEAFAVDGLGPSGVGEVLRPVLSATGVGLQGGAPVRQVAPVTDRVQRLAELHAAGALTDEEFRGRLGPVVTAAPGEGEEADGAGVPARMPDAAREAALDRLAQLRLSGVITDAELAAMKAKLLE